jgi:hypothetical protein
VQVAQGTDASGRPAARSTTASVVIGHSMAVAPISPCSMGTDVTDHGRLIARIVPVAERAPAPVLERLVASGRATLARRPGYRPRMRAADGTNRLSGTVAAMRDEEGW